jgi:hypothetical protein
VDEKGEVLDEACAGDMDNEIKTGKWMRCQMAIDDCWLVVRAPDDLNWVDEMHFDRGGDTNTADRRRAQQSHKNLQMEPRSATTTQTRDEDPSEREKKGMSNEQAIERTADIRMHPGIDRDAATATTCPRRRREQKHDETRQKTKDKEPQPQPHHHMDPRLASRHALLALMKHRHQRWHNSTTGPWVYAPIRSYPGMILLGNLLERV